MLFPAFTKLYIIPGLVYEHTMVEPMVVQRLDESSTSLVFVESKDIGKLCSTLLSIKMWLGHIVNPGCNVSTPKQMMTGD